MIRGWAGLSERARWGGLAAVLGIVAALPWGLGYSYSRGYDLFLWTYNAWYLKQNLLACHLPNWSPFSAAGQPFFKVAGLADSLLLGGLMALMDPFPALRFFVVLLCVAAAMGLFQLSLTLTGDYRAAAFASGAYVLSWFLTFTAHFQAYLSNLMVYAALPWFVLLYHRAVQEESLNRALGACLVLALCICTNPQVSLKVALIGGVWVLLITTPRRWWAVWVVSGMVALGALWLSAFNITSALGVRAEALSVNYRLNSYTGPFTLVAVPLFALNLVSQLVAGFRFAEIPLWEVLYSEYPGVMVAVLAAFALALRGQRQKQVRALWALALGGYGLYFLVVPQLRASEWVGTSHNLIILPTFALALLAGYGALALRSRLRRGVGRAKAAWILGLVGVLGLLELGGLKLALVSLATTRTAPPELPEARLWQQVAAQLRQGELGMPRFFTYNPDHTVDLFPVVTGCATANVIELRQRLPEYESFLKFIRAGATSLGGDLRPSRHLALLNVKFVDLPAKLYEYQGPNAARGDYTRYTKGLELFDQDVNLQRFAARDRGPEDLGHDVRSTEALTLASPGGNPGGRGDTVQVVYRNQLHFASMVAAHAVAIVGDTRKGEKVFEEIAGRPDYQPGRVLYLLVSTLDEVAEIPRRALSGYIRVEAPPVQTEVPELSLVDLGAFYQGETASPSAVRTHVYRQSEEVEIELDGPTPRGMYLFVSQQRFASWKASDQAGGPLGLYKAQAGLTGVFLPAGTSAVRMYYELPWSERSARWFSAAGVLVVAGVLLSRRQDKKCLIKNEVSR